MLNRLSLLRTAPSMLAAATVVVVVAAACGHRAGIRQPESGSLTATSAQQAEYVGSAACAKCHPKEFRSHQATAHAAALRGADRGSLGALAPPEGPIRDTGYRVKRQGDAYLFVPPQP